VGWLVYKQALAPVAPLACLLTFARAVSKGDVAAGGAMRQGISYIRVDPLEPERKAPTKKI